MSTMREPICCGIPVAVVGGAGFLGSHLVNHLINDRACNVLVIDNLVSGRKSFLHPEAHFEHHDITTSESYLLKLFDKYDIEYVFNYAAQPYIPVSFDRPSHVFATNATGAINVINAATENGCQGVLQVSSAEIYGWHEGTGGISEDCPVCPHSTYGVAKAAIDSMVQVRWHEAKTPCMALRQFNCVGERETHPYIVPELFRQFVHEFPQRGYLELGNNSTRDFLYAGDAVAMAVELLEKGRFGEVYNLGAQSAISIYDLAKEAGHVAGYSISNDIKIQTVESRKRPWEIWHLLSDNTKIHKVIDYRPKVTLHDALKRTFQSYKDAGFKWCWE